MSERATPYVLVGIQFTCLAVIALTGPLWARNLWLAALELLGLGLGLWAVGVMRPGNFNITHRVRANGQLVTRGPYRWIRHPMYAALLVATLALVLADFTLLRLAVWGVLLIVLVVKMGREERLLAAHYDGYAAYQARSHRLLPLVY